jgi:hypothetical protein
MPRKYRKPMDLKMIFQSMRERNEEEKEYEENKNIPSSNTQEKHEEAETYSNINIQKNEPMTQKEKYKFLDTFDHLLNEFKPKLKPGRKKK